MMFNFFKYKNGENIPLRKLRYKDIQNFLDDDWEEGYTIEFKESFDKSVKSKIPSIFTSFANGDGGLLIIGIEDNSRTIVDIQKPRGEIYASLSQIIENKISPLSPKFYAKFVENPNKKGYGVIVAYIEEGALPPYMANGTIYVREASRKVPITPDRSTVDFLYKKRDTSSNISLMSYNDKSCVQFLFGKPFRFGSYANTQLNDIKKRIDTLLEKIKNYNFDDFTKNSDESAFDSFGSVRTLIGSSTPAEEFFLSYFNECKAFLQGLHIEIESDFFNLHGLNVFSFITGLHYDSHDKRSQKCEDIKSLHSLLKKYVYSGLMSVNFKNCFEYCFVITNFGGKFDEDINLIVYFPKNSIVDLSNEKLYKIKSTEFNSKFIEFISNKPLANIEEYDNYSFSPLTSSPPLKGTMLTELDYEDEGYLFKKFQNDIENTVQYELYQDANNDIIKVKFNKILPKQSMYLPCKIITCKEIKEISYEIISKHSANIRKSTLVSF